MFHSSEGKGGLSYDELARDWAQFGRAHPLPLAARVREPYYKRRDGEHMSGRRLFYGRDRAIACEPLLIKPLCDNALSRSTVPMKAMSTGGRGRPPTSRCRRSRAITWHALERTFLRAQE